MDIQISSKIGQEDFTRASVRIYDSYIIVFKKGFEDRKEIHYIPFGIIEGFNLIEADDFLYFWIFYGNQELHFEVNLKEDFNRAALLAHRLSEYSFGDNAALIEETLSDDKR